MTKLDIALYTIIALVAFVGIVGIIREINK